MRKKILIILIAALILLVAKHMLTWKNRSKKQGRKNKKRS